MATKTSILVFYLRLSRNTQPILRMASWGVLGIVNVAGAVLTLINIFQCRPVQAAFDPYTQAPGCLSLLTQFICSAPINIVTDLAILALPLPVLTSMRLPFRQKIILVFTFALGIFVTVVDVVRIYYLQQAVSAAAPSIFGDQAEFAWNASLSLMWSAVEVNVGIMCACIPTLKPLIVRILPAMIIDPDGTRGTSGPRTNQPSDSSKHFSSDDGRAPALGTVPEEGVARPEASHPTDRAQSDITAMDFLTTPDMLDEGGPKPSRNPARASMATTASTATGGAENAVYFGFVSIKKPKSIIRTSTADSWKYCTWVTILFLLWGFSYGLLNTLNNVIASVASMSPAQTIGLTSMYFGGGYFFGPLIVGEWVLRHDEHRRTKKHDGTPTVGGFKATFMVGLCIYGVGTIMFWPSAVLASFPGFMICSFVVGFGLAVLETAANPFIALCGPLDYAEMRLLLSQGVQAVASLVCQLLAQKVFFTDIGDSGATGSMMLLDVQWMYLAITLFCVALALFFYYLPLPEVTDAEMERSTKYLPIDPKKRSIGGLQLRTWTLILAVLAQWTYVAGQESMSIFFRVILAPTQLETTQPSGFTISILDYLLVAHTAFAVSRFLAAYLAYLSPTHPKVPQPRTVLNICTALSILLAILIAVLRPTNPNHLVIPIVLFFFFEGPMWPLIFTLGLRGQGKRTKRAAAYITMGASGPVFWPFVIYVINQNGADYQTAFIVVPALLVLTAAFALFLDLKRDARALVDSRVGEEEQSRIQANEHEEMGLDAIIAQHRHSTSKANEEDGGFVKKMHSAMAHGFGHRRRSSILAIPTVEHHEERGRNASG
jgi:fucose permease